MPQPKLRLYCGPESTSVETLNAPQAEKVNVPLCEIFPLLADAVDSKRTWLEDFGDDEISISADLYDVILSYQHFRRPSA